MFIRKDDLIRCGSRLLLGNLLLVLIILGLRRLFLIVPRFNRLLISRTHGFRRRLSSCHLLRVFGAHAGGLGRAHASSVGSRLRCSNFGLEECTLWMRLRRLKAVLYLVALSIFTLVFVEVK